MKFTQIVGLKNDFTYVSDCRKEFVQNAFRIRFKVI